MKLAKFDVTFQLLEKLLPLPDGTEIRGVTMTVDQQLKRMCTVYIEHPDFPEVPEGAVAPRREPTEAIVDYELVWLWD